MKFIQYLLISIFFVSSIAYGQDQAKSNDIPDDFNEIISKKIDQAKDVIDKLNSSFDDIDKLIDEDIYNIPEEQKQELDLFRKDMRDQLNAFSSNVFMVMELKGTYIWIHVAYPPKIMILPPNRPLNQGIVLSKLNVEEGKLPIIFVFGKYKETVHLIPKANTPVALISVDAKVSGLAAPAFKVTYDMTLPKVYNSRYSLIANFEIYDCHSDYGGAVHINNSKCLFLMNNIHDCSASVMGGGMYCIADISVPFYMGVMPLMIKNNISNCSAPQGGGMAFQKDGQSMALANTIANCQSTNNGGGVHFDESSNYFIANNILKNATTGNGGGISMLKAGKVIMSANTVADNKSPGDGGGIWIKDGSLMPPVIVWNTIVDNEADGRGGGIYVEEDANAAILMNMPIAGNKASYGGGIAINKGEISTAVLGNNINNNNALSGGGIWAYDFDHYISAFNKISANKADINGGGIYLEGGDAKILRSRIEGNEAVLGGGIYATGNNKPDFEELRINENKADEGGGLYIVDGTNPEIENCGFHKNDANNRGGAIFLQNVKSPEIDKENKFMANSANLGGGIFFHDSTNPVIDDNIFQENSAEHGGAVYVADRLSTITRNKFYSNVTYSDNGGGGGAIYIMPGMSPFISGNDFSGNKAYSKQVAGPGILPSSFTFTPASGGGIYTSGEGSYAEIENNDFKWNEALYGGGISVLDSAKPKLLNNTLIENLGGLNEYEIYSRGGGIYIRNTDVDLIGNKFIANHAENGAGVSCEDSSIVRFLNCEFKWNIADIDSTGTGTGGGIFAYNNAKLTIGNPDSTNIFMENFANSGGAVSAFPSSTITMTSNTFSANRAAYRNPGYGGAVYADKAMMQIGGNASNTLGNIFEENTAGSMLHPGSSNGYGGAIALKNETTADILGNMFARQNAANKDGGAIYADGALTRLNIGGSNNDSITNFPLPVLQKGNIFQNNNRAMNILPVFRDSSEIPSDKIDSIYCELEEPVEYPDTSETRIPFEFEGSPTISTTVEPQYLPNVFAYMVNLRGGVIIWDIKDIMMPVPIDTLISPKCYSADLGQRILVVSEGEFGISIYDTSPLQHFNPPILIAHIEIPGDKIYMATTLPNYVFAIGENNIIYIIEKVGNTYERVGDFQIPDPEKTRTVALASSGGYIYHLADDGLTVILRSLVRNGNTLDIAGNFISDGHAVDLDVRTNDAFLCYAAGQDDDLTFDYFRLNITDPFNIQPIPSPTLKEIREIGAIKSDADYCYFTLNDGFIKFDYNNGMKDDFLHGQAGLDIAIYENAAILSEGYNGMSAYDKHGGNPLSNKEPPSKTDVFNFNWVKAVPWEEDKGPDTTWFYDMPEHPDTVVCDAGIIVMKEKDSREIQLADESLLSRDRYVRDVEDTIITENGGAIAIVNNASAEISGNLFGGKYAYDGNKATGLGGAIYLNRANNSRIGALGQEEKYKHMNFFLGNYAAHGGGIAITNTEPCTITNNTIGEYTDIQSNRADSTGGGIYAKSSFLEIENNFIQYNFCGNSGIPNTSRDGFGGGIAFFNVSGSVEQNWLIRNTSHGNAGGIGIGSLNRSTLQISKNTFSENYAIKSRISHVEDTVGIGTDLFMSNIKKDLFVHDNIFDHFGTYQSYSIYVDSSKNVAGYYNIELGKIRFEDNDVFNNTGYRYGGLSPDRTGENGNISVNPLFTDPANHDFNLDPQSPADGMGWNFSPAATVQSSQTITVPGDFPTITAANNYASYGDRIIVNPGEYSSGETFPIILRDGIILTGTAFNPLDLNMITRTKIYGNNGRVFILEGTGPRTAINGITIVNGRIYAHNADGMINGNIIYGNEGRLEIVISEMEGDFEDRFFDGLRVDHNTIIGGTTINYDTIAIEREPNDCIGPQKIQFGPMFTYNISSLESNFVGGENVNEYIDDPPVSISFEKNDFWPDGITGYYDNLNRIADYNMISENPLFSGEDDLHLMKGSACLFLDSTITDQDDTLTYLFDYTGMTGALYQMIRPVFYADTLSGPPGLQVEFTDSSLAGVQREMIYSTLHLNSRDSIYTENPKPPMKHNYTYDSAGTYDVILEIRDRYATFYGIEQDYITIDTSWKENPSGDVADLRSVYFTDNANGWIAGDDGVILHTSDGGESWALQNGPGMIIIRKEEALLNGWNKAEIEFISDKKSNDRIQAVNSDLNSIHFIDRQHGFACGKEGTILKTENGGSKWDEINSGVNSELISITFVSSQIGFIGGKNGFLLKTTDSGESWTENNMATSIPMNSLFFINKNTGYACGESGLILKSVNGGESWAPLPTAINESLNDIYFVDDNTGYSVGNNGIIIKTTNAGQEWQVLKSPAAVSIYGAHFVSQEQGHLAGANGRLFYTKNGILFRDQFTGVTEDLLDIFFTDEENGWAVGANGTILSTNNGGITSVDAAGNGLFLRVFPNPLSNSASIEYFTDAKGRAEISIYDILGNKISSVFSGYCIAGTNRITWNTSNDSGEKCPAGVYILKISLQNGNRIITKSEKIIISK